MQSTQLESHSEELRPEVAAAAARILDAMRTGAPCPPVRDLIGATDIAAAYAVQRLLTRERERQGSTIVGRKIGLTAPVVQQQLGVDQPDFGVLFDDMQFAGKVPVDRLISPRAEAELAFLLADDLVDGPLTRDQVRAAVGSVCVALEVVDSRIQNWDITITDTVADNASSGAFVVGSQQMDLVDVEPAAVVMEMTLNGQVVSSGTGGACLGDPLNSLAWLAKTARDLGEPLLAGQLVLSGALGPMTPVADGDHVVVTISGFDEVTTDFVSKSKE